MLYCGYMLSDTTIIHLLQTYQIPALFLGAGLISEAVIIPAAALAQQGVFHLSTVYVVALMATMVSDAVWFKGAKLILRFSHKLGSYQSKVHRLMHAVEKITGKRTYLFLMAYKFFYGFRSLTIIALSMRHYPFWKYMLFSGIGTAIWLAVVVGVGWLVALGLNVVSTVHTVEYVIGAAVTLVVGFKLVTVWLGKEFAEEEDKIEAREHRK